MRVTGGGQLIGDYIDVELDRSAEPLVDAAKFFPPDSEIDWRCIDGNRYRVTVWRRSPCDARAMAETARYGKSPGSAAERLRDGKTYQVIWERDGLAEIRFDEDGCCYVVRWEEDCR